MSNGQAAAGAAGEWLQSAKERVSQHAGTLYQRVDALGRVWSERVHDGSAEHAQLGLASGPHTVHCPRLAHLPSVALLTLCTVCGTGWHTAVSYSARWC